MAANFTQGVLDFYCCQSKFVSLANQYRDLLLEHLHQVCHRDCNPAAVTSLFVLIKFTFLSRLLFFVSFLPQLIATLTISFKVRCLWVFNFLQSKNLKGQFFTASPVLTDVGKAVLVSIVTGGLSGEDQLDKHIGKHFVLASDVGTLGVTLTGIYTEVAVTTAAVVSAAMKVIVVAVE